MNINLKSDAARSVETARRVLIARLTRNSGDVGGILLGKPEGSQGKNGEKK